MSDLPGLLSELSALLTELSAPITCYQAAVRRSGQGGWVRASCLSEDPWRPEHRRTSQVRAHYSAELKGPRQLLRIRPEIFDFERALGLKRGQTKPKIPGKVPTDRHTTIPDDSGPISACFDDEPKLLTCELAQPSFGVIPDPCRMWVASCKTAGQSVV